MHNNIYYRQ